MRASTDTVFGTVDQRADKALGDLWEAAGGHKWQVVETILFHVGATLNEDGVPAWWPAGLPKRRRRGDVDSTYAPVFAPVDPQAAAVLRAICAKTGAGQAIALESILHWAGDQMADGQLPPWWPTHLVQEALIPA